MKLRPQLLRLRIILLCAALVTTLGLAAEFHVAIDGKDTNPGTRRKPFATLERARDAIRELKSEDRLKGTSTVYVHSGDYLRSNALELTAADSGTAQSRIVWREAKGDSVRLLGGRRLEGFHTVTNGTVLARLDTSAHGQVVEIDLRALGITDFGEMKARGYGRASTSHCELFYDHKPMTVARWPNEGEWEHIAGFPESDAKADGHGGKVGKLESGFTFNGDRPSRWKDTTNLWVHGYWAWDWANSYERVATLDLEKHLVLTAAPHGSYGFRKGQRFYFLNVLEELDQPGEWFLDQRTGVLYFWPPGDLGKSHEVLLSQLAAPFLKLSSVTNVTIQGFTLEATRATAVEIQGGQSNLIANCIIQNIGNGAVKINGGTGHGVDACDLFDTGDGGVSMTGGDRQTLTPAGYFVENCHFARQGRWSKTYVPAVLMTGVGMRASHNLIRDHPHCAILFNGNDHLVEFNEIHHIALETGDVGAVYAGRDYTYRGNRVRHNFIHHTGGVGLGAMGIYMDDCVSGTEIFGNIFYKVQRAAFLGGGRDHQVINNIFVECNYAVELDARGLDQTPVWHDMVDKTMRERLTTVPLGLYREHYPALESLDAYYGPPDGKAITGTEFKGVPPAGIVVARNVCVGKWLKAYWHATPAMLQLDNNLTNTPPLFVGTINDQATAKDFDLRSASPAWPKGFEKIPTGKIGPQRSKGKN